MVTTEQIVFDMLHVVCYLENCCLAINWWDESKPDLFDGLFRSAKLVEHHEGVQLSEFMFFYSYTEQ